MARNHLFLIAAVVVLMLVENWQVRGDQCPFHPDPVAFSTHPMPDVIQSALDQLQAKFLDHYAQFNLSGAAAVMTYRDQVIWSHNWGYKNLTSREAITENTLFKLASITKLYTAILTLQLTSEISPILPSLAVPLAMFDPNFSLIDPFHKTNGSSITFGHLLTHSSGLPREPPCDDWAGRCCNLTSLQILDRLKAEMVKFPPGFRAEYSNLGYDLIGNLLADRLGISYSSLLQTRILKPLNMTDSGVDYPPQVLQRMAVGYTEEHPYGEPYVSLGWATPSAGMYSSILDQTKLLFELDKPQKLFKNPTVAYSELMRPGFLNPDGGSGFGFGWQLSRLGEYLMYYKGGTLPGFRSILAYIPDLRIGLAVLTNGGRIELTASAYAKYFALTLAPAFKQHLNTLSVPNLPPQPKLLIGRYEGFNITMVNGALQWSLCDFLVTGECSAMAHYVLNYRHDAFISETIIPMQILSLVNENNATVTCMQEDTMSFLNEWIYFYLPGPNQPASVLTVPGLFPEHRYKRVGK